METSSNSTEEFHVQKSSGAMDILPDELYGLVLGFLTNQSEELLLCKGVSKKMAKDC
jgi:hypothetical protein